MATYHLTVKNGKKGNGMNHAQYIEREDKYAPKIQQNFNQSTNHLSYVTRQNQHSKRDDLIYKESGNLPAFCNGDEKKFWLSADKYERKNGRVYTEIEFSLPKELNEKERIELAQEFVKNVLGVNHAYTFAIHNPKSKKTGEEQPHVHLMFSERKNDGFKRDAKQFFSRANPQKPWAGGAKKDSLFTHQSFIYEVRKEWSKTANNFLKQHGYSVRIDERSYKDRGINLESQNVKYPYWNGKTESVKDLKFSIDQELALTRTKNGERIIRNPEEVLKVLTSNDSTFTKKDLEQYISSHTDGEEQYKEAYNAVINSNSFQKLVGIEEYTSVEMYNIERDIIEKVDATKTDFIRNSKVSDNEIKNQNKIIKEKAFSDEQKEAFKLMTDTQKSIVSVNGSAGTGKSYVLQAVNKHYNKMGYEVHGIALQSITAKNMRKDGISNSRTIAQFLYNIENGKIKLNEKSVIILDEAGMVGSKDMQKILELATENKSKVRMVGDSYQLSSVASGDAYKAVQEYLPEDHQCELTNIIRQKDNVMREASIDLAKHNIKEGLEKYEKLEKINEFQTQDIARSATVIKWHESKAESKLMLAYTNSDVNALNARARILLQDDGKLGKEDYKIYASGSTKEFSVGDKIIFKQNKRDLGIINGSQGVIRDFLLNKETQKVEMVKVQLSDSNILTNINLKEYNHFNHAYALTIHNSQGQTVDETHILLSKNMDANLTYVGLSRHREDVKINYSKEQFKDVGELKTVLSESKNKEFSARHSLDKSFNQHKADYCIDKRVTMAEKYGLDKPQIGVDDIIKFSRDALKEKQKLGNREFKVGLTEHFNISVGDYVKATVFEKKFFKSTKITDEFKIKKYVFEKGKTHFLCESKNHPNKQFKINPEYMHQYSYRPYLNLYKTKDTFKKEVKERFLKDFAQKNQQRFNSTLNSLKSNKSHTIKNKQNQLKNKVLNNPIQLSSLAGKAPRPKNKP